jgi:hypothetical protein
MTAHSLALPDIASAKLPATYEAAKHALAECSRIDECQDWADKAQAMASYAKQAKDETLRKMSVRIQARAIRRCGELLEQVIPKPGARSDLGTPQTRGSAADAAGLSERQRKTALRVAKVSAASFERQVESDDPPSPAKLADQGTKPLVDLKGRRPHDYARATQALGTIKRFAEFASEHDPIEVAAGVMPHEVNAARAHIAAIDSWLDRFVVSLGD